VENIQAFRLGGRRHLILGMLTFEGGGELGGIVAKWGG